MVQSYYEATFFENAELTLQKAIVLLYLSEASRKGYTYLGTRPSLQHQPKYYHLTRLGRNYEETMEHATTATASFLSLHSYTKHRIRLPV